MNDIKTLNEELNKHNFAIKAVDLESGNPTFYLFEINKGSKTITPNIMNIKRVVHSSSNEEQFLNYCQTLSIKLGHSRGRAL
jgi:hypothetical protein